MDELEQYYSQAARELEHLRTLGQPSALARLKQIDPTVFEFLTALLFEERGYPAVTTGKPGDEGVDVLLQDGEYVGVVQCKRYDGSVGQPTIRDLYGTMFHNGAEEAYLVTTGTVTRQARDWAFGKPIYLVDGDALAAWVTQVEPEAGGGFSMPEALGSGWLRWPLLIAGLLLFVWGLFYAGAQLSNRFSDQPTPQQSVAVENDATVEDTNIGETNTGTDSSETDSTGKDNEEPAPVDSATVADTIAAVPATAVPATAVPQAPVATDTATTIPTAVPLPTKTATTEPTAAEPTAAPLPTKTATETVPTIAPTIAEPTSADADAATSGTENSDTENPDTENSDTENSVPLVKPTRADDPTVEPTLPPTPTPLPPTPTAAPIGQTCEIAADESLRAFYNDRLGCATDAMQIVWAAWEPFERGMMLWRSDTDAAYAFVDEQQQWFRVYEKWDGVSTAEREGPPPDSAPELQAPVRGFGYIWGTNDALFNTLGWATDEEKGICLAVQTFEMGTILQSSQVESCTAENLFNQASTGDLPLFTKAAYENGAWE